MSLWYEVKKQEDVSFSDDGSDLHLYLYSDESGAVYASVPFSNVVKELARLSGKEDE